MQKVLYFWVSYVPRSLRKTHYLAASFYVFYVETIKKRVVHGEGHATPLFENSSLASRLWAGWLTRKIYVGACFRVPEKWVALTVAAPFGNHPVGIYVFAGASILKDLVNRIGDLADDGKENGSFKG